MSAYRDWKVGDKVVCLQTWFEPCGGYGDEVGPVEGVIYTIREIGYLSPSIPGKVHVRLCEIVNKARPCQVVGIWEQTFRASRFRPVQKRKTDISIFTAMLTDNKVDA